MTPAEAGPGLGTRMRHVLELLEGDVAAFGADLGLPGYRPRFSPIVRALTALGPSSIRTLAGAVSVTHSAASQTVAQLQARGLVTLAAGHDARQRIVHLTDRARALLPVIEAEWAVTEAAARELDAELPVPLGEMLDAILAATARRPFRQRLADAAAASTDPAVRAVIAAASPAGTGPLVYRGHA
jgi:DNA-binding MarR family transcriptional regulator